MTAPGPWWPFWPWRGLGGSALDCSVGLGGLCEALVALRVWWQWLKLCLRVCFLGLRRGLLRVWGEWVTWNVTVPGAGGCGRTFPDFMCPLSFGPNLQFLASTFVLVDLWAFAPSPFSGLYIMIQWAWISHRIVCLDHR